MTTVSSREKPWPIVCDRRGSQSVKSCVAKSNRLNVLCMFIRMLYVRNNVNEISGGNGAKLIILIDNDSH